MVRTLDGFVSRFGSAVFVLVSCPKYAKIAKQMLVEPGGETGGSSRCFW
jgi:hypothetical protein